MVASFSFLDSIDGLGFGDYEDSEVGGEFVDASPSKDHITSGLSRLPWQFKDSENYKHLVQIFLEELQEIEDTAQEILRQTATESAVGKQLDLIGEDVGIQRDEGISDFNFRRKIRLKILANISKGTYSDVSRVLRLALGTEGVVITPEYPAGFLFVSDSPIPLDDSMSFVRQAVPITVKVSTVAKYSTNQSFCFAGGAGKGFGSVGYPSGTGGEFRGRKEYS